MAPKQKEAKKEFVSERQSKADAKEKAEQEFADAAQDAKDKEKREEQAKKRVESIKKGPGQPPHWIMDCGAKLRDYQTEVRIKVRAATKLHDQMHELAKERVFGITEDSDPKVLDFAQFFAGALACSIVGDEDEDVRCASVAALGALDEAGVPYLDSLTRAILKDKCPSVRCASAKALSRCARSPQKKAAQELCKFVFGQTAGGNGDNYKQTREEVCTALANMEYKQLPLIADFMKHQNQDISKELRHSMASKLLHAIMLPDTRRDTMASAINVWSSLMIEGLPDAQLFCQSFLHKSDRVKLKNALESLLPVALNDPDSEVRKLATASLSNLNFATDEIFKLLGETLEKDSNPVQRLRAARAFDSFVRLSDTMAAESLKAKGHEVASAAMLDAVPMVRLAAATALGGALASAEPYVQDLVDSLKAEDKTVRKAAARGLGAIGVAAATGLRNLFVSILEDEDFAVRYWACESLGRMGDGAVLYLHAFAAVALYDVDPVMKARSNDAIQAVDIALAAPVVDRFSISEECSTIEADMTGPGVSAEQARQEKAVTALDAVGIPHKGLWAPPEDVKPKKGGASTGSKRDKAEQKKRERYAAEAKNPTKLNTDFVCDVGKLLACLARGLDAVEEEEPDEILADVDSDVEPPASDD